MEIIFKGYIKRKLKFKEKRGHSSEKFDSRAFQKIDFQLGDTCHLKYTSEGKSCRDF